jgi:DNA recombination protein RmuC
MLEGMLSQTLPNDFYETQFTFRNGNRVDAVIRLAGGLVSIDAKFPMESFRRLTEAEEADRGRQVGQFRRDMRRHIDAIAEKYICPGETLDFALMYIPAENVYYEIVLKADKEEDILNYAWGKRVFPTSPNSFYAYLQIIALGLRGLQVEESAKLILDSLARLKGDFEKFADDYRLVGTHLGRALAKHSEGLPKLENIQRTLPGDLTGTPSVQLSTAETAARSTQEPLE